MLGVDDKKVRARKVEEREKRERESERERESVCVCVWTPVGRQQSLTCWE